MTITVDWINKLVLSTGSITDILAFKNTIRDLEDDDVGILYQAIITYKRIDLGAGSYFHAVDFINGYQLKFPNAGNYIITGNINAAIVGVAGVFVDRTKSAAFASLEGTGGGGASAATIAAAVRTELAVELARIMSGGSGSGGGVSAIEVADAVRTNLTVELANLDVKVSSRIAHIDVLPTKVRSVDNVIVTDVGKPLVGYGIIPTRIVPPGTNPFG